MINELFVQIWRAPPVLAAAKSATNETNFEQDVVWSRTHGRYNSSFTVQAFLYICYATLIRKCPKTWREVGGDIVT